MEISRQQLDKEVEQGLNARVGLENKRDDQEQKEINTTEYCDRDYEEAVML